jgi:hypothetical protein
MKNIDVDLDRSEQNKARLVRSVAGGAAAAGAILSISQPAKADAITALANGVTSMGTIITAAQPIVIGVLIFSAATQVLKRLVYS